MGRILIFRVVLIARTFLTRLYHQPPGIVELIALSVPVRIRFCKRVVLVPRGWGQKIDTRARELRR